MHYLWAIRQLSEKLDCDPTEQAVLEARAARSQDEIDRLFMADANISWLLVDDGYPDPADTVDRDTQARRTGARIGWVERIEVVAGNLVAGHATFAEFDEAMRAHLASARQRGVCGLKSVAAYRSGLAVAVPGPGEAEARSTTCAAPDRPGWPPSRWSTTSCCWRWTPPATQGCRCSSTPATATPTPTCCSPIPCTSLR